MATGARQVKFRLYLITDRKLVRSGNLYEACEQVLAAPADRPGAIAIQLREKDLEGRALYELALRMRELCTRYGAPLLINDRIDVAIACGADGVHLPANSFTPEQARALLGESRLIGVSTHSSAEVAQAASAGADFVVYGPVFQPLSKTAGYGAARGAEGLGAACRAAPIPVYALGGITAERMHRLTGTGLAGAAAIGAVLGAEAPGAAARALLAAVEQVCAAAG
ncbi:MAG TPA: thiamine phosphate synthase [Candidatus Binataceae bacterium]|nr:thiamine phosphate synthase [Candidatus Binataceae bacterium]